MAQPICPVPACTRWSLGPKRPLCATHSARLRKHGDVQEHRPLPGKASPLPSSQAHLYLIQGVDGGPVKIGRSSDVVKRLLAVRAVEKRPLRLVSVIPNRGPLEPEVHARFIRHQRRGEWFDPAPEIFEWFRGAERAPDEAPRALYQQGVSRPR